MVLQNIINNIYKEIEIFRKEKLDTDQDFTFCFRGESADYGETKLSPTLLRKKLNNKIPDKELINLISDYKVVDNDYLNSISKAIEGQHFLALSRLLDITFSILPAIFFATDNEGEDGYVYIFRFPKTFSPSSSYINEYYEKFINQKITPYHHNFKVLSHTQTNERIKSQSGGFILFPGEEIRRIPEIYYKKVTIKSSDKKDARKELNNYFNISESTIYPEKDKKREIIEEKLLLTTKDSFECSEGPDFYYTEVRDALERIKFELETSINSEKIKGGVLNKKEIKRIMRKEEKNLYSYLDKIEEKLGKEKGEIKNYIKNEFNYWNSGL